MSTQLSAAVFGGKMLLLLLVAECPFPYFKRNGLSTREKVCGLLPEATASERCSDCSCFL